MQSRRFLTYTGIFSAALVAAAGLTWSNHFRPLDVPVVEPSNNVPVQVYGLGTMEARRTSKIGFKIAGVVAELNVDIGDSVRKGDLLARLDDREQQAQLSRSEAAVRQSEANLQRAKASVERAQANHENARSINERRQTLLRSNNTSQESAQTAQAAQESTLGDLNLARSDVLVAEANITDAKAQRQLQGATLEFHSLAAPYDSLVTARSKDLGATVSAGESVFTIIDPQSVWVLSYIDESKAGDIRVGAPAEIVLRSQPRVRHSGRVARIQPESDRVNEERRIEVAFERLPENYGIGEQAEVYITTAVLSQAIIVPETALTNVGSGHAMAWTVHAGEIHQYPVVLGSRLLDGRYEILSGLPDTARAIVGSPEGLRVGRAARLVGDGGK